MQGVQIKVKKSGATLRAKTRVFLEKFWGQPCQLVTFHGSPLQMRLRVFKDQSLHGRVLVDYFDILCLLDAVYLAPGQFWIILLRSLTDYEMLSSPSYESLI